MTHEENVKALQEFGYTEREASFLALAALHSGYFLRRQFCYYADLERGAIAEAFITRAESLGHIKAEEFRGGRQIYHVGSKPLYQALGEADNRHRRKHEPGTIKMRLMSLDYVLSGMGNGEKRRYFPTEFDKMTHFTRALKFQPEILPSREYASTKAGSTTIRYFVDKFPMFVPEGAAPVMHFCFVDEGTNGITAFETYMNQYRRLWIELSRFVLVYVASSRYHFNRARLMFDRRYLRPTTSTADDPIADELIEHFKERAAIEANDYRGFSQDRLIQYRDMRKIFYGKRYDVLFGSWKDGGDGVIHREINPKTDDKTRQMANIETYELQFNYELFGNRKEAKPA